MFDKARILVLSDRAKAREALADEIKRNEREELDAELDQLEAEEKARIEAEEAKTARANARHAAREALKDVRSSQNIAALNFDAAMKAANDAFETLESLSAEAARLEKEAGDGDGQRPLIRGHARSSALVAACWNSARPLCKRLGMRVVPGSVKNVRPLTTVYPNGD